MKIKPIKLWTAMFIAATLFLAMACSDDDDNNNSSSYTFRFGEEYRQYITTNTGSRIYGIIPLQSSVTVHLYTEHNGYVDPIKDKIEFTYTFPVSIKGGEMQSDGIWILVSGNNAIEVKAFAQIPQLVKGKFFFIINTN